MTLPAADADVEAQAELEFGLENCWTRLRGATCVLEASDERLAHRSGQSRYVLLGEGPTWAAALEQARLRRALWEPEVRFQRSGLPGGVSVP